MSSLTALFMSIQPSYADAILSGTKSVELRCRRPRAAQGTPVVVYASAEVGRIVGVFEIAGILNDTPTGLWRRVRERAAIDKPAYDAYFAGVDVAHAIEVANPRHVSSLPPPWRPQPGWLRLDPRNRQHRTVLRHTGLLLRGE